MTISPIVHVTRGPITESVHFGHIAVTDSEGRLLAYSGEPETVVYARSSMKPIQALPVVESGAVETFGFAPNEVALLCASHNGEEAHEAAAFSMLVKMGLDSSYLQCGAHPPFDKAAADRLRESGREPTSLHNNCSGKHSGMLALALRMSVSPDGYLSPEHPVQRAMTKTVSEMSSVPVSDLAIGVDGCGVPVFGLPLQNLSQAFAQLGRLSRGNESARGKAAGLILQAIRENPFYLAGTGRYDTRLIEVTNGRIIGKMGAEGVFALTVPKEGLGLALKVADGTQRAIYPTVTEALSQLGLLSAAELEELSSFHQPVLQNWQGTEIGRLIPCFTLNH